MTLYNVLRRTLLGILLVVIVGLAASLALRMYGAHRFSTAKARFEREAGTLDPAKYGRPDLADEDNAVTWIQAGVGATVLFDGDRGLFGNLNEQSPPDWTPDDRAKLEKILERNAPAIALLDRARGMTHSSWRIPYREGMEAKLPNLLAGINAAKMLRARAKFALSKGDRETAIGMAEDLGAMARSYESEPVLIVLLIGTAIERQQQSVVRDLAAEGGLSGAEVVRLGAAISDIDLSKAFEVSLLFDAAGIARDIRRDVFDRAVPHVVVAAVGDLAAAYALERYMEIRKSVGQPVTSPLRAGRESATNPSWWHSLVDLYGPNVANASSRMLATMSSRDLARLALALRSSAISSGSYPAAIPALSGVASNDPLTGGPRTYARHDDGSAELSSTTTGEIVKTIFPAPPSVSIALYRWTLPAPRNAKARSS
ncbi:MAG TPA: hypothetical protein VMR65_12400 [Candidatus Sulfotelmatobacter sp.]|jgi:hypothetical protein|nr:hypothetical protein [Candidatus Sulfotelmatobacter sp.]